MEVIVIADSRGRGLQQLVNSLLTGVKVQMMVHSGAGLELAAIKSIQAITRVQPKIIILMAGICDITWRDKKTKKTKLRYEGVTECVENVIRAAKAAYELLNVLGRHKISIATVTGLDLTDYNNHARKRMTEVEYDNYAKSMKVDHPQQQVLNEAVLEINRQITALNRETGIPTTWTSTIVHSYYRKVHHHSYKKLQDGCHPDEETRERWAKQITKSIQRISKGAAGDIETGGLGG